MTSQQTSVPQTSETATDRAGPGTVVGGRYTLRAAIGQGGMGTVWRATDTQLGRDVAVKEVVPPPGIAPDDRDAMYKRMLREARAAASLSHPGIVQVYDVVTEGERPWVVMELLDARSLSEVILEDGPLAPRAVAKIGMALLGALEVAHAAGVLHRDVKPANVLVCSDGRCVLTDFGVARMPTDQQLTTPGMVLGSPHFISPERAMGASFGPPSDLFSLGVTLYVAVEGQPPFDKGEPIATMHSVVEDEPLVPQRAGPLTEILYGLLEKDPNRRWDATAARGTLRELLAGPLTSKTPLFPTDPYAIVPTQRLPLPHPVGASRTQIGGRALLAPGELPTTRTTPGDAPTDRIAPPQSPAGPHQAPAPQQRQPDAHEQAGSDATTMVHLPANGAAGPAGPTSPAGPAGLASPAGGYEDPAGTTSSLTVATDHTEWPPPGDRAWAPAGADSDAPARPGRGAVSQAGAAVSRAAAATGQAGSRALAAIRRAPQSVQIAVAAGLAAMVLLGVGTVVAIAALGGDSGDPPPQAAPPDEAPEDEPPPFEVQQYTGRGVVVNLPADWQSVDNPELVYVDFVDPADASAQVRLLAENWSGDARRLVEVAEESIQNNEVCAGSYQQVGITDLEVAGLPGAQLEYTCGEGEDKRRARWATVVSDGTAYSFRLTAMESQFAEREAIFDELVRTFQLA